MKKKIKSHELKINIPGSELIVKKETKSFEEGASSCSRCYETTVEKVKRKRKGITALKKNKNNQKSLL